jgi:hypothetical protein
MMFFLAWQHITAVVWLLAAFQLLPVCSQHIHCRIELAIIENAKENGGIQAKMPPFLKSIAHSVVNDEFEHLSRQRFGTSQKIQTYSPLSVLTM